MRTAYKILAWLIAAEVMIQAAAIVYAVAGLGIWVDQNGGVLDKATMESNGTPFPEIIGFAIHGMNGEMIIPALALILMVVSFFARVPGGVKWAGFVLLAVVVQVALGMFLHSVSGLGALHGINALVLFSLAAMAGVRAQQVAKVEKRAREAKQAELV